MGRSATPVRFSPLLRLMRPANMVTAAADVLAGFAIGFYFHGDGDWPWSVLGILVLSTLALYAGGIVLNDVFDLELDRVERPERPLPSGEISPNLAAYAGMSFLLLGIALAILASPLSGGVAAAVAFLALTYDALAKPHAILGPLTMGACRAGNLLLGASAFGSLAILWPVSFIPLLFIAAVTLVSRGEVQGGGRSALMAAGAAYALIVLALSGVALTLNEGRWQPFVFIFVFAGIVLPPLVRAIRSPQPAYIGKAVKWGVLGLIPLDAAWGALFQPGFYGWFILLLLPISAGLAKLFAVT